MGILLILYKAIKYKILDYCLNRLLSGIYDNFRTHDIINGKDIYAGLKLSKVVVSMEDEESGKFVKIVLSNCTVDRLNPAQNIGGFIKDTEICSISFERVTVEGDRRLLYGSVHFAPDYKELKFYLHNHYNECVEFFK